jgi:CheY-like chemotaxis protein
LTVAWDWSLPRGQDNQSLAQLIGLGDSTFARVGLKTAIGLICLITLPVVVRGCALISAGFTRLLLTGVVEMRQTIIVLTEQKAAAAATHPPRDGPEPRAPTPRQRPGRAARRTGQTQETRDELRALSRGIAPPVLTDHGMPSALAALAIRSTVPIELAVDPELGTPAGRLDAAVETTAYFAVAEALTNVAKHSGAANCWVTVAHEPGRVDVESSTTGTAARTWPRTTACPASPTGSGDRWHADRGQPYRWADDDRRKTAVLKVVVADDSVLLREGLIRLLTENGHDVVAAVGDGPSLVQAVEEHRPDVSVVDVRMPPSHTDEGLRAAVEARRRVPRSPVLCCPSTAKLMLPPDDEQHRRVLAVLNLSAGLGTPSRRSWRDGAVLRNVPAQSD